MENSWGTNLKFCNGTPCICTICTSCFSDTLPNGRVKRIFAKNSTDHWSSLCYCYSNFISFGCSQTSWFETFIFQIHEQNYREQVRWYFYKPNLLSASYWIFKSFFISWANHYVFLGKVTSHLRKIFSLHFCRVTEINRFLLDHEYQGLSEATKVVRFVPKYDFNQLTSYTQKTWPNICQNNNL